MGIKGIRIKLEAALRNITDTKYAFKLENLEEKHV